MSASRIILGTANFLNPYGLYQKDVKLIQRELDKVISLSLADPLCAALSIYYEKTEDERANVFKNFTSNFYFNITCCVFTIIYSKS